MKQNILRGFLCIFILVLAAAMPISVLAEESENQLATDALQTMSIEGSFGYKAVTGGVEITRYTGTDTDLVLPETLGGQPVVALKDNLFAGNETVKKLTIPDNVVSMGYNLVEYSQIEELTIGTGLTEIPDKEFYGNGQFTLQKVKFKSPSNVKKIGKNAFYNCKVLTDVVIPDSVTTIDTGAFEGSSNLTITIPASVTTIGDSAVSNYGTKIKGETGTTAETYANNHGITFILNGDVQQDDFRYSMNEDGTVTILSYLGSASELDISTVAGKTVSCIGAKAFEGNNNIKKVTIAGTVTEIENSAFSGCSNLTQITLSEGLSYIDDSAFFSAGLDSIILPNSLSYLGASAFAHCANLKTATIGNGLVNLPSYCFSESGLEKIDIPNSIGNIGSGAFNNCKNLRYVFIPAGVMDSVSWPSELFASCGNQLLISCKSGSAAETYAKEKNIRYVTETNQKFGDFYYEDVDGGVKITGYVGNDTALSLSELDGKDIVSVGDNVFAMDPIITEVTFGSKVQSIGTQAFYGCVNLNTVNFNEGLTSIGAQAFAGTGLIQVDIPDSVISLGTENSYNGVFENCTNLIKATLGSGLNVVPKYIFSHCEKLTEVVIKGNISEIEQSAFSDCKSLEKINLPDSVTIIDGDAFYGCVNIEKITLPSNLQTIGGSTFQNCKELKEIEIPSKVTNIWTLAFAGCDALQKITIPVGATNISNSVFKCEKGDDGSGFWGIGIDHLYIYGKVGSTAETYAKARDIPFVSENTKEADGFYYEDVDGGVKIVACTKEQSSVPSVLDGKNVVEIGRDAFARQPITNLSINANIKVIDDYAFVDCNQLTNVSIGDCVTSLGIGAFYNCNNISNVNLGGGITEIQTDTFTSDVLKTVVIRNSANQMVIKTGAFCAQGLKKVYLPNRVQTIEKRAFYSKDLEKVRLLTGDYDYKLYTIPNQLTIFGNKGTAAESFADTYDIPFSTEIFTLGDVDNDGNINASDALQDLRHSVNEIQLLGTAFSAGDVTKDGTINASDALQILRYSVGEIRSFD